MLWGYSLNLHRASWHVLSVPFIPSQPGTGHQVSTPKQKVPVLKKPGGGNRNIDNSNKAEVPRSDAGLMGGLYSALKKKQELGRLFNSSSTRL